MCCSFAYCFYVSFECCNWLCYVICIYILLKEVAELPVRPSTGRMSACSSAPSYRNIILPGKKYLNSDELALM
jgi:hypothetical protein